MPPDLPAGPALDELVAVQVMGWQRLPDSIDGLVVHRLYRSRAGMETSWVPAFSTNIAFAWEVVEHLMAASWTVRVEVGGGGAHVEVGPYTDSRHDAAPFWGEAPTVPLAICRAALAAVPAAAALR